MKVAFLYYNHYCLASSESRNHWSSESGDWWVYMDCSRVSPATCKERESAAGNRMAVAGSTDKLSLSGILQATLEPNATFRQS